MKTLISVTAIILLWNVSAFTQTGNDSSLKRNGVFIEAYLIRHDFSEGFASVNYERNFGEKRRMNLRVGIYPDFETAVSFPITLSWISKPLFTHHFEYGIGAVYRVEHFVDPNGLTDRSWFHDIPAIMIPLMYRYQKSDGFYFRGGANIFVSWPTIISPSISAGYRF